MPAQPVDATQLPIKFLSKGGVYDAIATHKTLCDAQERRLEAVLQVT
jgi:hypothetical protein